MGNGHVFSKYCKLDERKESRETGVMFMWLWYDDKPSCSWDNVKKWHSTLLMTLYPTLLMTLYLWRGPPLPLAGWSLGLHPHGPDCVTTGRCCHVSREWCHEGHEHSAASIVASVAQSPMMIASARRAPIIQLSETRRQVNKQLTADNRVHNNNNNLEWYGLLLTDWDYIRPIL